MELEGVTRGASASPPPQTEPRRRPRPAARATRAALCAEAARREVDRRDAGGDQSHPATRRFIWASAYRDQVLREAGLGEPSVTVHDELALPSMLEVDRFIAAEEAKQRRRRRAALRRHKRKLDRQVRRGRGYFGADRKLKELREELRGDERARRHRSAAGARVRHAPRSRERRPRRCRTRSSARSGDSGSDDGPPGEPPAVARRPQRGRQQHRVAGRPAAALGTGGAS